MSKNISNLSGRIGLKKNLFEKISERSLNSKDSSGIKELANSLIPLESLEFNDLSEIFSNKFFFKPILPDKLLIFFDTIYPIKIFKFLL